MKSIYHETRNIFRKELRNLYDEKEIDSLFNIIFSHYTGLSLIQILSGNFDDIEKEKIEKIIATIEYLKKYMPIQYITNEAYFLERNFYVDNRVLIPRPETEELVYLIIRKINNYNKKSIKILDIGTGSGCIAITLKLEIKNSEVYACDISEAALEVAALNAQKHNAEVSFFKHDILTSAELQEKIKFDVIVSNPPYICYSQKKEIKSNVLNYEPHIALFVEDENPIKFYKSIASFAFNHLENNGELFLEINEILFNEVEDYFKLNGFQEVSLIKDFRDRFRFLYCKLVRN